MMTAAVAAVALAGCAQLAPAAEVQAYCQQLTGGDEAAAMRRAVVVAAVAQQQIDAEGAVAGCGGITAAEVRRAKRRLVRMLLAADAPGRRVEFDRDDEVTLWVWGRGYAVGTVYRLLGIEKKERNSGFNGEVKHDARVGGKAG